MKLQQTFDGTAQARASLGEDGKVRVQLQGSAAYQVVQTKQADGSMKEAPATVGVTVDLQDDPRYAEPVAAVEAALKKIMELASAVLGPRLAADIYRAQAVSAALDRERRG